MEKVAGRVSRKADPVKGDVRNGDGQRVGRILKQMPADRAFEQMTVALRAIADSVRVRILYALTIEPLCVCELSRLLQMSMPAVSHHLRILTTNGILKVRKEGSFAWYYIHDEPLTGTLLRVVMKDLGGRM